MREGDRVRAESDTCHTPVAGPAVSWPPTPDRRAYPPEVGRVPAPVAALLLERISNHGTANTATNPPVSLALPRPQAGQPIARNHLCALLSKV